MRARGVWYRDRADGLEHNARASSASVCMLSVY